MFYGSVMSISEENVISKIWAQDPVPMFLVKFNTCHSKHILLGRYKSTNFLNHLPLNMLSLIFHLYMNINITLLHYIRVKCAKSQEESKIMGTTCAQIVIFNGLCSQNTLKIWAQLCPIFR